MQDIIEEIKKLTDSASTYVSATVVKTWGSGPRKVGAGMVMSPDGDILGSVSGGCVEGNVIKEAEIVNKSEESKILHYGITDDEAWEVGLSCGGKIDILLEKVDLSKSSAWKAVTDLVTRNSGCVLTSPLSGSHKQRVSTPGDLDGDPLTQSALEAYRMRKSGIYEIEGETYFHNVFPRKSQLVIVGAAHISSQLVELAAMHDFETIVIDPRGLFTDNTRFSIQPDHTYKKWPQEVLAQMELNSDVFAVLLTHDPKIDDQALHLLLKTEVSYIGALGSSRTHDKRKARLTDAGFSEDEIARIHAPVGMDIRAKNPKEIALSIVAELINTRNQYL